MIKRVLLLLLAVIVAGGTLAWLNRKEIILYVVGNANKEKVAENRPLIWDRGPDTPVAPPAARPPNIVFILADDLGINDISTFGGGVSGGRVPTPNIDRLAAEGANFTQAYAGTATCAPSRAMLLTGRYPTRTGFEFTPTPTGFAPIVSMFSEDMMRGSNLPRLARNTEAADIPFEHQGLPTQEVTLAEVLKPSGYHNVHIGKWHLGRAAPSRPVSQGFDESLLMSSGLFLPEDDPDVVNAKLPFDAIDRFLWASLQYAAEFDRAGDEPMKERFEPGGYITDYWTDESLKVIEANRHRPFFLYLAHWGVHTPLQATQADYEAVGDIEPHRLRVYAAMVRSIDRSVGRIMDKLAEEGLAENTIVVFSSDNGGAGYIGLPEVNAPFRGWKATLFEGGIRVPLFIKWPARIAPGTVIDTPVAHIDIMPTLAAAADAPLPAGVVIDGQNLIPAATGEGEVERPNNAVFWSSGFYRVVRAGDWKLQINERHERTWLYDLATDPTEQRNLAEARPGKLAELQALIDAHWANARPPLYPYTMESPVRVDKTNADPFEDSDEYIIWPN